MCVNGAWRFTPQVRVVYLENKRVKTHIVQIWINTANYKHAKAIGFVEGRDGTWPIGTHSVDGGVWNA
jgi:hypothetical protein